MGHELKSKHLIKNEDIVCFSRSDWDTEMVSNRFHIMSRFALNNRVFFFEKPFNPFIYIYAMMKGGTIYEDNRGSFKKALRIIRKRSKKFYTITPFSIELPPINFIFIRILNNTLLNSTLITILYFCLIKSIFKIKKPILWFYDFRLEKLLKTYHQLSCYHLTEDYRNMEKTLRDEIAYKDVARAEDNLEKKVDVVFSVSEHLCNTHKVNNKKTFCIINGVDFKQYSSAWTLKRKEIILGYIGNISSKIELDLLLKLSNEFKTAHIALVGPIRKIDTSKLNILKKQKNITFYGKKDVRELPHILSSFSVCLIPFISEDWFVECSQPLKLFEYMASGKPIVSTYMNCLKDLPDGYVYVSENHKEFIQNVHRAITENNIDLVKKRIEFAGKYDWDIQFEKINLKMMDIARNKQLFFQ